MSVFYLCGEANFREEKDENITDRRQAQEAETRPAGYSYSTFRPLRSI